MSNETNVNLNADESSKSSNSANLSFDEIESATFSPKQEREIAKEITAEISSKPSGSDKESQVVEKKDLTSRKKLSYSQGEDIAEIDSSVKFKHKVGGEDVEVELQELLNNFAGKTQWDKKFQELSSERNKFKQERDLIEKYVQGFAEISKKGDALGAMEYLAQLTGQSPHDFRKTLRDQLSPEIEKWKSSTEEQRRLMDIEEENAFLRRQRESEVNKVNQEKTSKELESRLVKVQQAHGVTDKELIDAYDILVENYPKDQVNPDLISKYFTEKSVLKKATDLISEISPSLLSNTAVVDKIADMIYLKYDDEELKDIISNSFAKRYATKTVKKSKVEAKPEPVKPITNAKSPIDWDDL